MVKDLLTIYSYDRLVGLLEQFFSSQDKWIRQLSYSVGAFRAAIPKLLVEEQITVMEQRDRATGRWVPVRKDHA